MAAEDFSQNMIAAHSSKVMKNVNMHFTPILTPCGDAWHSMCHSDTQYSTLVALRFQEDETENKTVLYYYKTNKQLCLSAVGIWALRDVVEWGRDGAEHFVCHRAQHLIGRVQLVTYFLMGQGLLRSHLIRQVTVIEGGVHMTSVNDWVQFVFCWEPPHSRSK